MKINRENKYIFLLYKNIKINNLIKNKKKCKKNIKNNAFFIKLFENNNIF